MMQNCFERLYKLLILGIPNSEVYKHSSIPYFAFKNGLETRASLVFHNVTVCKTRKVSVEILKT